MIKEVITFVYENHQWTVVCENGSCVDDSISADDDAGWTLETNIIIDYDSNYVYISDDTGEFGYVKAPAIKYYKEII